jgi:zinc protease
MKKKLIYGVLAMCFAFSIKAQTPTTADPNQPQLIEKITAKPGELIIPYEKWKLPNGLILIVHEDHSDPIVHVEVTYHVGSARETPGKSGFAHFFEHMMFQGSEHIKKKEHDQIVHDAGGDYNGNTTRDRTMYFETMPKNYLETGLWLEADRMGFLLDSVTQVKFENQRATVKNEKGQGENRPYGKTDGIKDQILYPPNHPYSWSVIGTIEDLNRVDVEDLKNFFMRWYGPNNATLIVAGDVNSAEVLKLAMKYFGNIPRGPEVRKQRVDPVRLPQNVYANYGDKVYFPLLLVAYPSVPSYHQDEPALDLLASIFGQGVNSILYKNFVKSEKAAQAVSYNLSSELSGEFTLQLVSFPSFPGGDAPVDMEALLKQSLDEFDKTGIDDDALLRAKASLESGFLQSLQSVAGKANMLSSWGYLQTGKTINVNDEIARYNKVTKEDIMRVFRQYVLGKSAAIVNVFPKEDNAAANKEEVKIAESSGASVPANKELEYKGLSYKKPVDNFDRSKKPAVTTAVTPIVPKMYTAKFDNGLNIIGTYNNESPYVTLLLNIRGGNYALGEDLANTGLANLTAAMMEEATQKYTPEQFSNEIEKLGASIGFSAGKEFTTVVVNTPRKNLDKTLELFEEKLLHPKFTSEDFKRDQKLIAEDITSQKVDASAMASKAFARLIYGKSIAAEPVQGTIKSIRGMNVKNVQSYYDKFYSPTVSNLVIVGDITQEEIMPKLAFLKNWAKKDVQLPSITINAPVIEKTQIYLVDKYKAPQAQIRMGYLAMPFDFNGKFFKANIMNYTFGGGFVSSRLNGNLREDKGYTYGIYSGFSGSKNAGPFYINAGVKDSTTDLAMKELLFELKKYRDNGISDEELAFTKKSLSQGDALRYETSYQKAGFLSQIVTYNLPADYIEQQDKIVASITKDEVNSLAKELLPVDKMVIVIVGDKDLIRIPLEKLGYKVIDYKLD